MRATQRKEPGGQPQPILEEIYFLAITYIILLSTMMQKSMVVELLRLVPFASGLPQPMHEEA